MAKRKTTSKRLTIRMSAENADAIEEIAAGTGRSENWGANLLMDAGRNYLKSGHPQAEQIKTYLRQAEMANARAIEARAGERKAREAIAKLTPPARIAKHLPRGAA